MLSQTIFIETQMLISILMKKIRDDMRKKPEDDPEFRIPVTSFTPGSKFRLFHI